MAIGNIEDAYRVYFPLIREKCSRMLRDPNDAQDIAQETFIRLWKSRDAVTEPRAIATWLYRTSTRMAVDRLRQRRRRPTTEIMDDKLEGNHGQAAARLHAARVLDELAAKTPKKELEAAILSRIDGLSHFEIGQVLGQSERTVRRLLKKFDARAARIGGAGSTGNSDEIGEAS